MNNVKKIMALIMGGVISIVVYLIGISIYTRISSDPIIFFASLVVGIIGVFIACIIVFYCFKIIDKYIVFLQGCIYFLGIIIIAVFGPTFIDRSISYHIAFYAAEEQSIDIDKMKDTFSNDIFEKRIHDALATGIVTQNTDGTLKATKKAKLMYYILKPLGELTDSMDTYYEMRDKIDK